MTASGLASLRSEVRGLQPGGFALVMATGIVSIAAELLGIEPPPVQDYATAELSPMARTFYRDNRRVRNERIKQELGVRLAYPSYREGLAALLPMCLMSTGVQTYLATFARSFKEAQTYMGFLIMVPVLPGMLSALYPVSSKPWMYPIPLLGQHMLAADVLGGKPAPLWAFLVAGTAALVVTGAPAWQSGLGT